MVDREFSDTVQLIYEAGLDFNQWPRVLERLAELLGASMTCLVKHNVATCDGEMITVRAHPDTARRYAGHYARTNVFAQRAGNRPAGTCMTDRSVLPKEELFKTEFYADFLRPEDVHSILSVYLLPENGARVAFGRPHRAGEWEQEQIDQLRLFAPHLHRAAQIGVKLGAIELAETSAAEVLDRLAQGVLIVDAQSRPLFVNRTATEILAEADGLHLDGGGLSAANRSQTATIRRLVAAAADRSDPLAAGGAVGVSRRSMRRALSVLIAPMRVEPGWFGKRRPAAMVLVTDPEQSAPVPFHHLQQLYDLTPAEAAVTIEVLRGEGLAAVAANLGIAIPTVRTHLQRIFEKTRTRRQAELVRMVAQSNAPLRS
jgi:DNA-binding CsgD family transcriptional regulator/PAS domain-containing protein